MKKKWLSLLLACCMVSGALVGCGGSGDSGESSGDEGEKSTEELRFIDVSPSPERQAYYEGVFAEFEEETGTAVIYESVPWDDAADKLTILGTSEQLPDVITTHPSWLGQFIESDWIVPLTDYADENADDYVEAVKSINWAQEQERYGEIYSIPDGFMVKGIFYRKDWVEEIGYEIPTGADWTYDAYFDLIKALADESQDRYGNSFRGARGAVDPLLTYLQTYTGGYTYDEEGNFLLNSPECVEATEKWVEIYTGGYVPKDSVNWGFVEMVDNFTGGLTGTISNDSEVAKTCQEKMEPEQWGVLPMPVSTEDGMLLNTAGSPYSYTVSKTSENSEAAIELIDFLSRPENNIEYCKMGGLIPVKSDVGDDDTYGPDGQYAPFLAQLNDPNFVVPPTYGQFNYTDLHQDTFHAEFQKVLLEQQTSEEFLNVIGDELTTRMKAYLEENEGAVVESPKTMQ